MYMSFPLNCFIGAVAGDAGGLRFGYEASGCEPRFVNHYSEARDAVGV
jgi:hypothetical protein